jgi:hypothetical protein
MDDILTRLESKVLREVRSLAGHRVAKRAMRALRQTKTVEPDHEIGLYSIWESICFQRQAEESFFYDSYLDAARAQVAYFVRQLPEHEQITLWLITNDAVNWREDFEPSMSDDYVHSAITDLVVDEYLLQEADSWSNPGLRRAITRHEINRYSD